MAQATEEKPALIYEKKVTSNSKNGARSVSMRIDSSLTKEAFETELKKEFARLRLLDNEFVKVSVYEKGNWAFYLLCEKWPTENGECFRVEYCCPDDKYEYSGEDFTSCYWDFSLNLEDVTELFYEALCVGQDPLYLASWEKDTDEDDLEDYIDGLQSEYYRKFGEEFDMNLFDYAAAPCIDTMLSCISKGELFRGKPFEGMTEKEIEDWKNTVCFIGR